MALSNLSGWHDTALDPGSFEYIGAAGDFPKYYALTAFEYR